MSPPTQPSPSLPSLPFPSFSLFSTMAPPPSKKAAPADKAEKPVASGAPKKEKHESNVERPDQAAYNKDQDAIRAEIEVLQTKLVSAM